MNGLNIGSGKARHNDFGRALTKAVVFALLGLTLFWLFHLTSATLQERGIRTGLGFLFEPARTAVANSVLPFEPGKDTNGFALIIGAINTLIVSALTIVFATALGLLIGLGRLSDNKLARGVCTTYIEAVRNIPVLIHISIWYGIVLQLSPARDAKLFLGMMLPTNRGIYFSFFAPDRLWLISLGLALAVFLGSKTLTRSRALPGRILILLIVLAVALPWIAAGHVPGLVQPSAKGLRILAPIWITPELAAFLVALSTYSATFIAEIVRGSVQSIPRGQWEASTALALPDSTVRSSVIFPQAIRVALPSLSNEYIGIVKNSSLSIVIGYQEIVGVGNTVLFDTGQAVEVMGILAAFFIVVSLGLSAAMNALNARVRLVEG